MSTTETLCVVFSDIVGSTAKLVAAGDDVAEPMFRNHRESTRRLVSSAGGHHYQWLGDGFTAAFNSTTNAIQVALEVRRMSDGPDPFVSRTGVAVGEVALQADGELFGQTVVVASRLCASAEGGEILCTSLVADLVREVDSISFVDCGHSDLKGIAEPVPTLAVESEPSVATVQPEAAVLFGRSAELNRLTQVVDDASHGRGGLVLIGGEPGAGKTRLAHEVYVAAQHRAPHGDITKFARIHREWIVVQHGEMIRSDFDLDHEQQHKHYIISKLRVSP